MMPTNEGKGRVIRLQDVRLRDLSEPAHVAKGGHPNDQGKFKELISREVCDSTDLTLGIGFMVPGEVHPLHHHPNGAEFYYMIAGRCKITVEDEEVDAVPGMAFYFPKGCPHKVVVDGTEAITFAYGFDKPEFKDRGCVWLE